MTLPDDFTFTVPFNGFHFPLPILEDIMNDQTAAGAAPEDTELAALARVAAGWDPTMVPQELLDTSFDNWHRLDHLGLPDADIRAALADTLVTRYNAADGSAGAFAEQLVDWLGRFDLAELRNAGNRELLCAAFAWYVRRFQRDAQECRYEP